MHVLIAGCGFVGIALGRELLARGDRVTGVRRSRSGAEQVRAAGIEPLVLDLADAASAQRLPDDLEGIVACQSADEALPCAYRHAYVEANETLLLAARRLPLRAFVYTGSTGVFGQRDGSTVDEATAPSPYGPTAEVLAEAERLVLDAAREGIETRLVRISGLYGPGRTGVIDRVRDGVLALSTSDEAWMNWCHLEDAVATILAILDRGRRGGIYHATDAHPARRREVVTWIASRLAITPARRTEEAGGGANRRILGERTRAELHLKLAYPSFREGLAPLIPVLGEVP